MPITPFHFGPGAALHAAAPGQISFLAFGAANVLIDIEPGYYLLTHQFPLHRFCHTLIGATLIMVATLVLFGTASRLARYLPDLWHWKALTRRQIAWGAALGSYSHIVLDSVMHDDIRPLAPFTDVNPLWHIVSLSLLHQACLLAGLLGLAVIGMRRMLRGPVER
ncbi:MAG: hypothetical protein HY019_06100 [Aquabacterium sp.]|uniref:hypothetical protein n=1 Tax=Aquabacterium sp. TaxID=1872578 RepID=UPI0025B995F7|nr:hypothetical protein [Aquabacterium sp.]MBI3381562.1 hypothetical protein [Aquabacterium sp.]